MPGARRGIVLPAVLAVLVALALLSSLALFDAVQEWRVAGFADDQVLARAALDEGLDAAIAPPDLAFLCLSPPLARQVHAGAAAGGGRYRLEWSHLGAGLVRAEVEGRGRIGGRARAVALLLPDSAAWALGVPGCPTATRLRPAGSDWVTAHPAG